MLDRSFGGFDEYLKELQDQRVGYRDEAERLLGRWTRYALARMPDGSYRRRALRAALEAEWASIMASKPSLILFVAVGGRSRLANWAQITVLDIRPIRLGSR